MGALADLALARAHSLLRVFPVEQGFDYPDRLIDGGQQFSSFSSERPAPGASQRMCDEARAACFAEAE